jgi:hypothetical protein
MITRTIIGKRPCVIVPHTSEIRFIVRSHPVTRITPPNHYTVTKLSTGEVKLTEYASESEWFEHRASVARTLAKYHSRMGVQAECQCDYCKGIALKLA